MRKRKVLVVDVNVPKVSGQAGNGGTVWEVTVIYTVKLGTYLKKVKRNIFTTYKPELHTEIEAVFL